MSGDRLAVSRVGLRLRRLVGWSAPWPLTSLPGSRSGTFSPLTANCSLFTSSPPGFRIVVAIIMAFIFCGDALCGDYFQIDRIRTVEREPRGGSVVVHEIREGSEVIETIFVPHLEVDVSARQRTRTRGLTAKVYFYDERRELIGKPVEPYAVDRTGSNSEGSRHGMPVFLGEAGGKETLYFALPKALTGMRRWSAVVVLGDKKSVVAKVFPSGMLASYDFPEKPLSEVRERIDRAEAMDPLIEYVVKTRNERHPQITLFVRPPMGVTDASEVRGVLAMSVLANNVGEIRRRLQGIEEEEEMKGFMGFAQKHRLLIVCWGARRLWDSHRNWDDLAREEQQRVDRDFEDIAAAWQRGVGELADQYGFPKRGYLLHGSCAAGQYVARLALRSPAIFDAVHIHISSSYDRPRPEGARMLWCVTTGELDGGYERSLRFFHQAREAGYPMVYKAIMGLGHAGHPYSSELGYRFFELAMELAEERAQIEADLTGHSVLARRAREESLASGKPWPEIFRDPPYVGDVVNQAVYPADQIGMVPPGFLVRLPSKNIMEVWKK